MQFLNNIKSKIMYDSELKDDIFKIGIMLAVSRVVKDGHMRSLDNKKFLLESIRVLLGFAVYHLIVKDYAQKIQLADENLQLLAQVAIKVGTVLAVPKLLKGKELNAYTASYVIAGFGAHALFKNCFNLKAYVENPKFKLIADDIVFAGFTTLVPIIVRGGRITRKSLFETFAKAAGFGIYDLFLA